MQKFDLNEFNTSSHQEWREKILTDLKGKSLESLQKNNVDHLSIRPDYTSEDAIEKSTAQFISNTIKNSNTRENWWINQVFKGTDHKALNTKMLHTLNAGVDSISVEINTKVDFNILFKDIIPEHIEIRFINATLETIQSYIDWTEDHQYNTALFEGTFEVFYHQVELVSERIEIAHMILTHFPKMSMVNINGGHFYNQGATNLQQIGIGLAMAHEILAELIDQQIEPQKAASLISFSLAAGADFFAEIAKFRAFKALWAIILKEYGVEQHLTHVHGVTSTWTQTVLDINNNMLRSSTQALSAILGGCQTVTVTPFDASVRPSNEFSERMARNTQLIIRDEAFAGKVVDIASGSYYIEQLTLDIANQSWNVFLDIENLGGFLKTFNDGTIDKWIETSREKYWEQAASGATTILGVNKYPNPSENKNELFAEKEKNKIENVRLSDAIAQ
jgi:methylmalonyl-CoA mutase